MNAGQRKTLAEVFRKPTSAKVEWKDIQRLIVALGGEVLEGSGSRVKLELNGIRANIHAPHPQKELKKYAVEILREFLEKAGVRP